MKAHSAIYQQFWIPIQSKFCYVLNDSLEVDFVLKTANKLIKNHSIRLHTETLIYHDHYTSTSFIS